MGTENSYPQIGPQANSSSVNRLTNVVDGHGGNAIERMSRMDS